MKPQHFHIKLLCQKQKDKFNGSTKWTYHNERTFSNNYFIFLNIYFRYKNLLEIVDLMY